MFQTKAFDLRVQIQKKYRKSNKKPKKNDTRKRKRNRRTHTTVVIYLIRYEEDEKHKIEDHEEHMKSLKYDNVTKLEKIKEILTTPKINIVKK